MPDGAAPWMRATIAAVKALPADACLLGSVDTLAHAIAAFAHVSGPSQQPTLAICHPQGPPPLLSAANQEALRVLIEDWPNLDGAIWVTPLACLFPASRNEPRQARDRFLIHAPKHVTAVCLRKGSSMLRALCKRLQSGKQVATIAADIVRSDGVDARGNQELAAQGADMINLVVPTAPAIQVQVNRDISAAPPGTWRHLAHHTADQDQPWPGESVGAFLSSLKRGAPDSKRGSVLYRATALRRTPAAAI